MISEMVTINKDQMINVEGLKQQLLARKTSRDRFRWELTPKQAEDILLASYQSEVEYRHRRFIADVETKANIEHIAKFLTSDNAKFGIMLCGVPGNGKTTLLYAFQAATNWLNDIGHFKVRKGIRIIDAKEIAQLAKDYASFCNLRNMPMIAIEDMGREPTEVLDYGNVMNPVIDLIEYRYNLQLFTFITTNLTKSQIREKYGNRIADRFNEMLEVIIFKNETYRK